MYIQPHLTHVARLSRGLVLEPNYWFAHGHHTLFIHSSAGQHTINIWMHELLTTYLGKCGCECLGLGFSSPPFFLRRVGWILLITYLLQRVICCTSHPRSHQTLRPISAVRSLGIMFKSRCWLIIFHTIIVRDADGWCMN